MSRIQCICKRYVLPLFLFFTIAAVFFWVVHERWERAPITTDPVTRSAMAEGEGKPIEAVQQIWIAVDELEIISFDLYVQDPSQAGQVIIELSDEKKTFLRRAEKEYTELKRDGMNEFRFSEPLVGYNGQLITLTIQTDGGIWLGYGNAIMAGKMEVDLQHDNLLQVNSTVTPGVLVLQQSGSNYLEAAHYYWPATGVLGCLLFLITLITDLISRSTKNPLLKIREVIHRYRYLLKQLVFRDFKVKYKASLLGFLWSFLNPLLTTLVYYVVFSNLFNTQENFVVYLMSGTILFNYVSESTSLGLNAIVGNTGLITKVYLPKFIFPVSKALSSAINLLISMIPLMVLMMLSHLQFSKAIILIPVLILFLVLFCTGLSLLLSSLMVFFRDTQFLWSVAILMWNFLSPVFYPESIIPVSIKGIYRMNPLYQYMSFLRSITLDGMAPGPQCFVFCLVAALVSMSIGLFIFRKLQHRFAFYL